MDLYYPFLKQGLKLFAPGGRFGKLQILLYHRVLLERDPLRPWEVTRKQFDEQMQTLSKYYQVLSLPDAMHRLYEGRLPAQAVCITFDDGYEDNVSVAMPILLKYGLPATFFIATGFLQGDIMWNDKIIESIRQYTGKDLDLTDLNLGHYLTTTMEQKSEAVQQILNQIKHKTPRERNTVVQEIGAKAKASFKPLMMNSRGVSLLSQAGMDIGAHTVTHPILNNLEFNDAKQEIQQSKNTLENILQKKVKYFAYPNGYPGRDYNIKHCNLLKKIGFEYGFSTWWGAADPTMDQFQLPRFTPWDKTPLKFMFRMTQFRHNTKGQPVI
tara:strand:- start:24898 stop:25875 length:978 start_codon:yes stop_codon:yes gene_type:complete